MDDDAGILALVGSLEDLLARLEQFPGPTAETGLDAVACLAEVYGEALRRVLERCDADRVALAEDPLLGHLMALHGLHPAPVQERVAAALREASPALGEALVQLVSVADGVATVRVVAAGCGSSAEKVLDAVRDVVLTAAPELSGVEQLPGRGSTPLIPVESLLQRPTVVS